MKQSELALRMLAGMKLFMLAGTLSGIALIAVRLALLPPDASTIEATSIAAPHEATAMSADGVVGNVMPSISAGKTVAAGQPAVAR